MSVVVYFLSITCLKEATFLLAYSLSGVVRNRAYLLRGSIQYLASGVAFNDDWFGYVGLWEIKIKGEVEGSSL